MYRRANQFSRVYYALAVPPLESEVGVTHIDAELRCLTHSPLPSKCCHLPLSHFFSSANHSKTTFNKLCNQSYSQRFHLVRI